MTVVADAFTNAVMDAVYVIDVAGTLAVITWVIVVLTVTAARQDE